MPDQATNIPQHVAIIMDGNGRWAKQRFLPRMAGHKAGAKSVKESIKFCLVNKIANLTLFACGHDNWQRPAEEVQNLMKLFLNSLHKEVKNLHAEDIQIRFIGERCGLAPKLQEKMNAAESLTAKNTKLKLIIALNYSGKWDILQATQKMAADVSAGKLQAKDIDAELFQLNLATTDLPPVDLFIRTSGEQRISNFLLWQLAYAEIYFSARFWPDFNEQEFKQALNYFSQRERRFGMTSEQIKDATHA